MTATVYRQDAFTLRNIASGLRTHCANPGARLDGGAAFTLPGLLQQASAWTGTSYAPQDAARAITDMDALTAHAETAAPSMTAAEAMARMGMGAPRRRRR